MSGCCKETRTEAESTCCSSTTTAGAESATGRCCQEDGDR